MWWYRGFKFQKFIKKIKLKTISHIIMDRKSGFLIKDDFDLNIAQNIKI